MKIIVSRKTPNKETLQHVYDILNKHIKNQHCFYTKSQVKSLKKNKENIWL